MPEFQRQEKRVGQVFLHSAVFQKSALQANSFWLAPSRKPARSAKVRLLVSNMCTISVIMLADGPSLASSGFGPSGQSPFRASAFDNKPKVLNPRKISGGM